MQAGFASSTERRIVGRSLLHIEVDGLSRHAVRALLAEHLVDMYATSPPGSVIQPSPRGRSGTVRPCLAARR